MKVSSSNVTSRTRKGQPQLLSVIYIRAVLEKGNQEKPEGSQGRQTCRVGVKGGMHSSKVQG